MNKHQLLNIKKMIFELGCGGSKNHFFDRVNDARNVERFFACAQNDAGSKMCGAGARSFCAPHIWRMKILQKIFHCAQNDNCENAGKRGRAARNFSRPLLGYNAGRSMLEMLGVLAIIGVLSVGAILGFRQAMNRHKANLILNDVSLAFEELATHETTGAVSRYQVTAFTPESRHTLYAKRDANGNDSVEVAGVVQGVCEILIQYDKTELYAQISDTAGAKLTACADNQTMVFGLGIDDSDPTPEPEPECTFDDDCADGKECKNGKCECQKIVNCKTQNAATCACDICEDGFEKNDAGECVEAAKSCDGGEIITAKNGDEFCISNTAMTWENAKIWCTDRGQRLPTIEEMCDGVSYNGAGTECENLKNSASVVRFPWSATVSFLASDTSGMGTAGPGCPVYVNMMSGTMACIGGDNFSPYSFAFCK